MTRAEKACALCGEALDREMFGAKNRKPHHDNICKPCRAQQKRDRYRTPEGREQILATADRWRKAHRDQYRALRRISNQRYWARRRDALKAQRERKREGAS